LDKAFYNYYKYKIVSPTKYINST